MNEFNPLSPIKYEKKRSDISVRSDMLERKTCTFYAYPNIINGFKRYTKFTGLQMSECFEKALIEYMQNHPVEQITLNVTMDLRSTIPTMKEELQASLLVDEIRVKLNILERNDERTYAYVNARKDLQKILLKAVDLQHVDPELEALFEKGRNYF